MKKSTGATIAFCMFGFVIAVQAQNVIPGTGGNATGTGGTLSYTIGQIAYSVNTGTNGSVAQGVQQPFEISVITGIEEAEDITLEFSVYPNPANSFVILKIENYEVENLRFQLYDISGKLLQNKKIVDKETIISLETHLPATYFLKVTDKNKELKVFKIIKK